MFIGDNGILKVLNRRVFCALNDGGGQVEDFRDDLQESELRCMYGLGPGTSRSSFSRSSNASASVSMMQCSFAIKQRRVASSRSVRSWTLSIRLGTVMVSVAQRDDGDDW